MNHDLEDLRALKMRTVLLLRESLVHREELAAKMRFREQVIRHRVHLLHQVICCIQARRQKFRRHEKTH